MFSKKTIKDINLKEKTVLVRTDYNVPIKDGEVEDDYRIKESLPTLHYLLEQDCKVVLMSHLGRPDGKRDEKLTLKPVANRLSQLLGQEINFVDDCVGEKVQSV